ncbi:universal stress protein [Halobellus inordinatus]|uniref:universal stress protein n=1 Tax=Halobellus inordinatus TaxID=1126236 RepID=UPI00210DB0E9
MSTCTADHAFARVRASAPLWIGALASVALFLFAVQLLDIATEAATVPLRQFFAHHVSGDAQALGVSWLATYVLTNGSIVAALSVSLFGNGIVTDAQLFLMVAGSRLGAEEIRERAHARSTELLAAAEAIAADHGRTVSTATRLGKPGREIVAYAEEHDADTIVLGSHGRALLTRVLLGSVAETVLQRAPMPVLIVR